ncbi:TetR/AcrR family transcriptional regulator [Nigerium massiliense]|uniref:TetR/AcrR family transcriptional regulator n=1 Tax=Nigerium massiliense TaxID=1522317 RepID=UPI00138DE4EF|nr:TetR/AcrR family transcriptional regulator [Nigerium massiliense]
MLDAAWRVMAAKGSDVSTRTITEAAGVGAGTLYRHFPTRDDLVVGVVHEVERRVRAVIDAHEDGWTRDAVATWQDLVHDLADLGIGAIAFQLAPLAERHPGLARGNESRADDLFGSALRRAKSAGVVAEDVDVICFFLGLATVTRPLPEHARVSRPHQQDWLVDVYLRGLRPSADGD